MSVPPSLSSTERNCYYPGSDLTEEQLLINAGVTFFYVDRITGPSGEQVEFDGSLYSVYLWKAMSEDERRGPSNQWAITSGVADACPAGGDVATGSPSAAELEDQNEARWLDRASFSWGK